MYSICYYIQNKNLCKKVINAFLKHYLQKKLNGDNLSNLLLNFRIFLILVIKRNRLQVQNLK